MTKEKPLLFHATNPRAEALTEDQVRVWFAVKYEDKELEIRLSLKDANVLKRYLKKQLGLDKKEDG